MKVLVTGGCGFIGSHLVEELLKEGHSIIVVDDLSSGSLQNISIIKDHPHFSLFIDSVLNQPLMKELVSKVDTIFHLAAAVGVKMLVEEPLRSIEINVRGTENVLKAASTFKKKVILTSSSEVYGKNEDVPFSEDDNIVLGSTKISRWSYGCTKALDEFLVFAYKREKDLPSIIVRLFNTIGPRQTGRYGMVVPRFISQALSKRPITVYGDGNQSRSFTYISDVIGALISLSQTETAVGEVFNVGSEEEITMKELALMVKRLTKSSSEIVYIPYKDVYQEGFEDMERRVPDISKIKTIIGYQPKISLEEGLKKIVISEQCSVIS